MGRGSRDPEREQKVSEVAALMVQHKWTIEKACRLVCIDVADAATSVYRRIELSRELPDTPTPAMIREQCEEIRKYSPRPMVGFSIPANAKVREYHTTAKDLQIHEKDT